MKITKEALFGSILCYDFRANSDIDLLLTFAPQRTQGLLTLAKIKHELEFRLNCPVAHAPEGSILTSDNGFDSGEIAVLEL